VEGHSYEGADYDIGESTGVVGMFSLYSFVLFPKRGDLQSHSIDSLEGPSFSVSKLFLSIPWQGKKAFGFPW